MSGPPVHRSPLEAARAVEGPPLPAEEARGILRECLGMAEAEHAEAILEASDHSLTRFANNEIHQNVNARDHALTLRVIVGRRAGVASTHRLDSSALRQLADRALAIARLSPEDPDLVEPAPPAAVPPLDAFAAETAASTPESRADAVGQVLRAAQKSGLNAAGALSTTSSLLAIANSRGLFASHPETYSNFTCTVRSANSSGWVDRHRRDARALEVEAQGRIAIEKAERSRDPQPVEPGPCTVILEPAAVAELVSFLASLGLGAQAELEGRSFMAGRMGQSVTGERATLVDDPFDPRAFGKPFDYEGTPRRRVVLLEGGIARAVVHDRRTAKKAGAASTGHACPPPATEGPLPYSLVLSGGDATLEELVAATERGILVTRFWYCRVVDPKKTIVTGMTRDGTFLIERGKLVRGLRNLRFNESVLEVLRRADGWGRDLEPTVFDYVNNCVVAPALRVPEFNFTGVSPS
jgi:predicted Zn-dependent protease